MKYFKNEFFEEAANSLTNQALFYASDKCKDSLPEEIANIGDIDSYALTLMKTSEEIKKQERIIVDVTILPENKEFMNEKLPFDTVVIGLESKIDNELPDTNSWSKGSVDLIVVMKVSAVDLIEAEIDTSDGFYNKDNEYLVITPYATLGKNLWVPSIQILIANITTEEVMFLPYPGLNKEQNIEENKVIENNLMKTLFVVDRIATLINCSNVTLEKRTPSRLKIMRAKKHKKTLKPYNVIKLPSHTYSNEIPLGGTHASPALHHRRGHYRSIRKNTRYEKRVWVRPCMVGDPNRGTVKHDYEIRRYDEKNIQEKSD